MSASATVQGALWHHQMIHIARNNSPFSCTWVGFEQSGLVLSRVFVSHSASRAVLLKVPRSTGNSLKMQTLRPTPGLLNKKFYGEGLLGDFESHCFEYCACVRACVPSCFSQVRLFVTLWTVAHQALLSVGFSREEYWSGLPCPPPGILLNPGIRTASLMSHALAGRFFYH